MDEGVVDQLSEILVVYLYISAQIWTLKFIFMDLVIMPAWRHLEIFFLLSREKGVGH